MAQVPAPGAATTVWAVEARELTRRFGETQALAGVDLLIREGEFFSLLGPSGCGKTTLLRVIAGLDHPDRGQVHIHGQNATDLPAHQRPVNTVFQSYALFPHLTVRNNVAFGLRMKRLPEPAIRERVGWALDLVDLAPLAERYPAQLSGGERQRVALARAVINEPKVLLLDEPLGALDLRLRQQLQTQLHALQRRLGITFLHVTHDQAEALALSDRLAVMRAGRLEQVGAPQEVYERPRTRFVAEFLGSCNILTGRLVGSVHDRLEFLTCQDHRLRLTGPPAPNGRSGAGLAAGSQRVDLAIRPERIQIAPLIAAPAENTYPASVHDRVYSGQTVEYLVESAGLSLRVHRLNGSSNPFDPACGQDVAVTLPPEALILLPDPPPSA